MVRNFPGCSFERYADDAIVHCKTRRQAEHVLGRIAARMREVGLRLHPDIETLEGVLGCTIQEALATYSGRDGLGTHWAPGPEIAYQDRGQQGRRDTV